MVAPSARQQRGGGFQRRGHLGRGGHVAFVEMPDKADPQAADAAVEQARVVLRRMRGAAGVAGIVPGHGVQQDGVVRTVRVIGPTWSSVKDSGKTPRRETSP